MRRRRSCTASATATLRRWAPGSSAAATSPRSTAPTRPGVVVVNETFARRYLANREPVGTTLTNLASGIGPLGVNLKWVSGQHGVPFEIVGVVADIRNVALGQDVEPAIYFTTRQFPFSEVVIAVRAADAGHRRGGRAQRAAEGGAGSADGGAALLGQPAGRAHRRSARAAQRAAALRRPGGAARGGRRLRPVLVGGADAHARAGDSPRARRHRRHGRRAGRASRRRAWSSPGWPAGWWPCSCSTALLSRVLYGVSARDVVATGAACAVLIVAALVATVPPAVRAMRVNPVDGLRVE